MSPEHHEYWCRRCGSRAPLTVVVAFQGLGTVPQPMKERICNSVDCAADVLERHAQRLRGPERKTLNSET